MANQVKITITGKPKGTTTVVPFSHAKGLQHFMSGNVPTALAVKYQVPSYDVRITGGSTYAAVRFGLVNDGSTPVTRTCDAGLSAARVCTPTWISSYSPHSFAGSARRGAWRLLPEKGFLIHEGADTTVGQSGGSLGCVEILDARWNTFLREIEALANASAAEIGKAGLLKVSIEQASYPTATLL
jgi:hypothetical protein